MPWPIVPAPITAMASTEVMVSNDVPKLSLPRSGKSARPAFDYSRVCSYTIRSTEKANFLSAEWQNFILKRQKDRPFNGQTDTAKGRGNHWFRPCGIDGRNLCRPRQSESAAD